MAPAWSHLSRLSKSDSISAMLVCAANRACHFSCALVAADSPLAHSSPCPDPLEPDGVNRGGYLIHSSIERAIAPPT